MEAFELRHWDGRLGRWLSKDPYGQYASPYLGMGNNPVNGVDVDGGFWQELGIWLGGSGWNSNAALAYQAGGGTLGEWVGNPFSGYRRGSKIINDPEGIDGRAPSVKNFKAVKDFNFKANENTNFRITAGLQAGFSVEKFEYDFSPLTTTLAEYNRDGWYFIGNNIEDRFLNPNGNRERRYSGKIAATGQCGNIEAGYEYTSYGYNNRKNKATRYIQGGFSSLLQVGVEKSNGEKARIYSTHTLINLEGKLFIGVEINLASAKFSFDLPN